MKAARKYFPNVHHLPIKSKPMGLLLATSLAGLVLVTAAFGTFEISLIEHSPGKALSMQAELIRAHSAAATASADANAVE